MFKDDVFCYSMIGQGIIPEQILKQLLDEENGGTLETIPIQFQWECSRDRTSNAILSLGSEEVKDMIDTDGQADAQCRFTMKTTTIIKQI
ncbi:Hsp33 family molecular chaperone HslO [Priestia filamentosa]|uniref:Hsp33 family molecular chaperone HslO n=1 Tax=Priestia filamentosa TaxID=1402861 RepID=UPI00397AF6F3